MVEGVAWWLETLQKLIGSEVVGWIVLILSPFVFIYVLLWFIQAIIELVKTKFIPLFYNSDEKKQKIRLRKRFADHIESEIRRLNQREDWNDFRFAELEAEVEMEGKRRSFNFLPFVTRISSGLRREKSLSKALKQSRERIILVEGDPGSGKSVALRRVALEIAKSSAESNNLASIIPIYLNLKELRREANQLIDRRLIEDFILKTLKRINDRDVNKFVDDEFYSGLKNGTWLFLFDSFDEIPDILGAEDADKIIREYTFAIYDFLHGLNACRGIVASRHFKGPGQVGWTRFKIINLTKLRQIKLVKLSELKPHHEKILLGNLGETTSDIQKWAENPLFLGLLVGYVQEHEDFPQHVDAVFGSYIKHRINQDKDRVQQRFRLDAEEIHLVAEKVAFCMSKGNNLGLSPTRGMLKKALLDLKIDLVSDFENSLDALEFMKLARSDNSDTAGDNRVFTFSHRRFQEYFATLYVLREGKISILELLTNPRWRETTVVLCQTQPEEQVLPLVEGAWEIWVLYAQQIYSIVNALSEDNYQDYPITFPWPDGCLYLLDLLQDGFSKRKRLLPDKLLETIGATLKYVTVTSSLPSRIWALEVAGVAKTETLLEIIRPAITDESHFLSDVAYRQVSKLENIPDDILSWIKKSIFKKMVQLGILKGGNIVYAQASRLVGSTKYTSVIKAIQFSYWIDIVNSVVLSFLLVILVLNFPQNSGIWMIILIVLSSVIAFIPYTIYADEKLETFSLNRFAYLSVIFMVLVPAVFVFKFDVIYFLIPIYLYFIFPSTIVAMETAQYETGIWLVLFTPFIALHQLSIKALEALAQTKKELIIPKKLRRSLIIAFGAALGLCSIMFVSDIVYNSDAGRIIVSIVSLLGLLYMVYHSISKTVLEDNKYRRIWKEWKDSVTGNVDLEEIVRVLPLISTRHAHSLFEKIREEKLLQCSKENLHFLFEMIRLTENPGIKNEFSESLKDFLMDIRENKLKHLLLDELFKSIAEMRYKIQ